MGIIEFLKNNPTYLWIIVAVIGLIIVGIVLGVIINKVTKNKIKQEAKEDEVLPTETEEKPTAEEEVVETPTETEDLDNNQSLEETESTKETKSDSHSNIYHVTKRKSDGKWQVKYRGGERAIKLFNTQAEAIEFAKKLAEKRGGSVTVHKTTGQIRKMK